MFNCDSYKSLIDGKKFSWRTQNSKDSEIQQYKNNF